MAGPVETYIRQSAIARGINPDIAVRVARSEGGLSNPTQQSYVVKNGKRETSFGPFQLRIGGGLGDFALRQGIDPRKETDWQKGVDFALNYAADHGWGSWYGAANVGLSKFAGITKESRPVPIGEGAPSVGPAFALQQNLKAAGFDPGPIDGVIGPQTQQAAQAYLAAGLPPEAIGLSAEQAVAATGQRYDPLTGALADPGALPTGVMTASRRVGVMPSSEVAAAPVAQEPAAKVIKASYGGEPPAPIAPSAPPVAPTDLQPGTLTAADRNADPQSRLSYAEQRDAFARQHYADTPWSGLRPEEQNALTEHFGAAAPTKYEEMRATLNPASLPASPAAPIVSADQAAPAVPQVSDAAQQFVGLGANMAGPKLSTLPSNAPYGVDKAIQATLSGDPGTIRQAWAAVSKAARDSVGLGEGLGSLFGTSDPRARIKGEITGYMNSLPSDVKNRMAAAYAFQPSLWKGMQGDKSDIAEAKQKASDALSFGGILGNWHEPAGPYASTTEPETLPTASGVSAWGRTTQPSDVTPFSGGGGDFLSGAKPATPSVSGGGSAWPSSRPVSVSYSPEVPHPKADAPATEEPSLPAALAASSSYALGSQRYDPLTGALVNGPGAMPIGVTTVPARVAAPAVAPAGVKAAPPPARPAAPKAAPITYKGGPMAGAPVPRTGGGVNAFSIPSAIMSAMTAARNAGYTTGIASPGYTSTSGYQDAMANGYTAPNFSQGSGGAIYSYKPNGDGTGTYVTTDGRTLSY